MARALSFVSVHILHGGIFDIYIDSEAPHTDDDLLEDLVSEHLSFFSREQSHRPLRPIVEWVGAEALVPRMGVKACTENPSGMILQFCGVQVRERHEQGIF